MKSAFLIFVLLAILGVTLWWAIHAWNAVDVEMSVHGYVAMTLGIIFSLVIGCGLMALMFYSSRHGYDDAVMNYEGVVMQQKTDGRVVRLLSKRHAAEEPGIEQWFLVAIAPATPNRSLVKTDGRVPPPAVAEIALCLPAPLMVRVPVMSLPVRQRFGRGPKGHNCRDNGDETASISFRKGMGQLDDLVTSKRTFPPRCACATASLIEERG
jgi:hypothetical protein